MDAATCPNRCARSCPATVARVLSGRQRRVDQRQNDVRSRVDSVLLHTCRSQRLPALWPLVQTQAEGAKAVWRQPDQASGRRAENHSSIRQLMLGCARPSGATGAHPRKASSPPAGRRQPRDRPTSSSTGWTSVGPTAALGTDALDARRSWRRSSTCRGRLACARPCSIADELSENGFVLRYRTERPTTGSRAEGTFNICLFWLVSALAIVGEIQRARDLMERLVKPHPRASTRREYDVDTGRHRQLPAGLRTCAAEAAARIILAEGLAEVAGELYRRRSVVAAGV